MAHSMSSPVIHPAPVVRPLVSPDEYRAAQELQKRAWGITQDGYVLPVSLMISIQHTGGLVLGAFVGSRLAGFSVAYLGRVHGDVVLFSQLTAVEPGLQSGGVGARLKAGQRAFAQEHGISTVAWCFDPLQSGNANFNIHKLRAVSRTYHPNFYGERHDALNQGLPTDRLLAEWRVDGHLFRWRENGTSVALVSTRMSDDVPQPNPHQVELRPGDTATIAVPVDIGAVKARDMGLASSWQQCVRRAFEQAFTAGMVAMDFRREPDGVGVYELRFPTGKQP